VEDATSVRVIYDDGTMVYAEGVLFDPNHDLAVLSLNHKSDKKAELYLGPPLKEKEHISHVGTPFGYLDDAYKEGSIINSQLYRLSLDLSVPYISASLEVVPGCSGGGVYYRGKLIGIVSRTIKETGQALIVPVNIQTLKLINTKFVELVPYK
jgi:S1-C subfamily serine protease